MTTRQQAQRKPTATGIRVGATAKPSEGKVKVSPTVEVREDGTIAFVMPAEFGTALRAGELYESSSGKTASPVHIPPVTLTVEREDGELVEFRGQFNFGASLSGGSVRI